MIASSTRSRRRRALPCATRGCFHRGSLLAVTAVALLLTGCLSAIRPYQPSGPSLARSTQLTSLTVVVTGTDAERAEAGAAILRDTDLFATVSTDIDFEADLTARVGRAGGAIKCGTPQTLTYYTLGLVPSTNVYQATIELEFFANSIGGATPGTGLRIERSIAASTKHGLWTLFARLHRDWHGRGGSDDHDPGGLATALAEELRRHEVALLDLSAKADVASR